MIARRISRVSALVPCVVLAVTVCTVRPTLAQDAPIGEIVQITGDLYNARSTSQNSPFLVTSDGIILTDPNSLDFAEWLKT